MKLILGSGSPRRKELLAQIGVVADEIRAPDIDESPEKGELPRTYCRRVARAKAEASFIKDDEIVLCADTTVALGRRILGKPSSHEEAGQFLRMLSGRRHRVITALAVKNTRHIWERDVVSLVKMKRLSEDEIRAYLKTNDWSGKAGGYGIQGPASVFIPWISGSYTAIMGLPLAETSALLKAAHYPILGTFQ